MNAKRGLVRLLPLFLVFSAVLEGRLPADVPPLVKPTREAGTAPEEPDPSVIREQNVEVDLRLVRDPQNRRLQLPLFDGTALDLIRDGLRVPRKGSLIWYGHVDGQPASTVILSAGKEVLIGNIATQPTSRESAKFYEIRYLGNRVHVLRQIERSKLPEESPPTSPDPEDRKKDDPTAEQRDGPIPTPNSKGRDEPMPTCTTDPSTTIDALVVYTPAARRKARGKEAMEGAIDVFIEETNTSYGNSGIGQRLRLVHMQEVQYVESGDTLNDRNRLKAPGGALGEVHDIRDTHGADVVALIVEYSITLTHTQSIGCGFAYVMESVSNEFQSSAFAVVPRLCADRQYSLTHEFGHLMGARHDWHAEEGLKQTDKPFTYSHGYVHLPEPGASGPAWRTLMSYDDECKKSQYCDRLLYWSNPNTRYPDASGIPMGVGSGDKQSNNSLTLNNTAQTVANFRCREN